jgi:ribonucleotide monophosphatase NagD (HAD superfamily)
MIKFNLYSVKNTETKESAKVSYQLANKHGKNIVIIMAKDFGRILEKVGFKNVRNDTDSMADFYQKDSVFIYEDDPVYGRLLDIARELHRKRLIRLEAKRSRK